MPLFLMPSQVSLELDRLIDNFFWEGNAGSKITHLVRRKSVCKPEVDGGLGIDALKHKKLSLIAKRGWRFMMEPLSFW